MKKLALMGVVALLLATPLAGCGSTANVAANVAADAVVSASSTSPVQKNALGAAENAYTLVARAALLYVQTAKPSSEVKAEMARLDNLAYAALVSARAANKRGDSPAVGAAVNLLKPQLAALTKYLGGLGVSLPALPAF